MPARIATHVRGNLVAYLALFVALGGTSYAAVNLPKNSIKGKQIARNAVGASEIRPRAVGTSELRANAVTQSKLGGSIDASSTDGRSLGCPAGTVETQGFCLEASIRAALAAYSASDACASAGLRLPTVFELQSARNTQPVIDIAPGGEWSSTAYFDGNSRAYVVTDTSYFDENEDNSHVFRCATSLVR